jgi:hypothetical protein
MSARGKITLSRISLFSPARTSLTLAPDWSTLLISTLLIINSLVKDYPGESGPVKVVRPLTDQVATSCMWAQSAPFGTASVFLALGEIRMNGEVLMDPNIVSRYEEEP